MMPKQPTGLKSVARGEAVLPALDSQTIALRIIAGLLVVGAAWLLADLLVPVAAAFVLAIILSPLADRLERRGLSPTLSSLTCLVLVVMLIVVTGGLLVHQGRTLVRDGDRYSARIGELLTDASRRVGLEATAPTERAEGEEDASNGGGLDWSGMIRSSYQSIGPWLAQGLGGLLGVLGQVVVFLAFLYYMLATREDWRVRIERVAARLGLIGSGPESVEAQYQIRRYAVCVSLVAVSVGALVTGLCLVLGLPTPLAWGVLAGLMEFVPYFGPLIAGGALTVVALATGEGWFEPAVVLAAYVVLQTVESYVVSPLLYGGAVRLNPVTVLFGLLFFGWIWGPLGILLALPMLVLLRTWVDVARDTPALDALLREDAIKE